MPCALNNLIINTIYVKTLMNYDEIYTNLKLPYGCKLIITHLFNLL